MESRNLSHLVEFEVSAHLVVAVGLSLDDLVARIEVEGVLDGEGVVEGARVEREAAAVPGDLRKGGRKYKVFYLLADPG